MAAAGGGIPLLWETFLQFLQEEFSVDVITILAIAGSLLLGEYLAGAFVVLTHGTSPALFKSRLAATSRWIAMSDDPGCVNGHSRGYKAWIFEVRRR
jgi:hypothetical protein